MCTHFEASRGSTAHHTSRRLTSNLTLRGASARHICRHTRRRNHHRFFKTTHAPIHKTPAATTGFNDLFLCGGGCCCCCCCCSVGPRPSCQGPGRRWVGRRYCGRAATASRDRGAQGHDRAGEAGRGGGKEESQGFRAEVCSPTHVGRRNETEMAAVLLSASAAAPSERKPFDAPSRAGGRMEDTSVSQ